MLILEVLKKCACYKYFISHQSRKTVMRFLVFDMISKMNLQVLNRNLVH